MSPGGKFTWSDNGLGVSSRPSKEIHTCFTSKNPADVQVRCYGKQHQSIDLIIILYE